MRAHLAVALVGTLFAGSACTAPLEGPEQTSGPTAPAAAASPSPTPAEMPPFLSLVDLQNALQKTLAEGSGRVRYEVRGTKENGQQEKLVEATGAFDLDQDISDLRYLFSDVEAPEWGAGTQLDPHLRVLVMKGQVFVLAPDGEGRRRWQRFPIGEAPRQQVLDLDENDFFVSPALYRVLPYATWIWALPEVEEWPEFSSYSVEIHGSDMLRLIHEAQMNHTIRKLPTRELRRIFNGFATVQIGFDEGGRVRAMKANFTPYLESAVGAAARLGKMKPKAVKESLRYLGEWDVDFFVWVHRLGDEPSFILPSESELEAGAA